MFMNLHLNKLSASGENSRLLLHNVTKKVKTLGEYPQIRVLLSAISKTKKQTKKRIRLVSTGKPLSSEK